jgi:MFS family permease
MNIYEISQISTEPTKWEYDPNEVEFEPRVSWLRWPLLFFFVNMIMIVAALSLCLSPVTS